MTKMRTARYHLHDHLSLDPTAHSDCSAWQDGLACFIRESIEYGTATSPVQVPGLDISELTGAINILDRYDFCYDPLYANTAIPQGSNVAVSYSDILTPSYGCTVPYSPHRMDIQFHTRTPSYGCTVPYAHQVCHSIRHSSW